MPIRDLVTILYFSCQSTRLAVERFTVSRTILDGMVRTWSQGRSETLGEVSRSEVLNSTPNPVITPFSLAGFEVGFPFVERFSGLELGSEMTGMVGFAAPKSVITSSAGFGARRPHTPGGLTAIPAAFR